VVLPVSLPATELSESGVVAIDAQQPGTRLVLQRRPLAFTFGCFDRCVVTSMPIPL
jgi:hypothetical protein